MDCTGTSSALPWYFLASKPSPHTSTTFARERQGQTSPNVMPPYVFHTIDYDAIWTSQDEREADTIYPRESRLVLGFLSSTDASSFMTVVPVGESGLEIHSFSCVLSSSAVHHYIAMSFGRKSYGKPEQIEPLLPMDSGRRKQKDVTDIRVLTSLYRGR